MRGVSTVVLSTARFIFQVDGAGASGAVVFRKQLTRGRLLAFFTAQSRCGLAVHLTRV